MPDKSMGLGPHPVHMSAVAVAIPAESRVRQAFGSTDLADAYEIRLPQGTTSDPKALAQFIFSNPDGGVSVLMQLRDLIVGRFGLKTAADLKKVSDPRIGLFKVYETNAAEIILGEDDKHLDFRVSVLHRIEQHPGEKAAFVVVSTVVHCHNRLGRLYLSLVEPFHRRVVKAMLRRAALRGWPAPAPGDAPSPAPARP